MIAFELGVCVGVILMLVVQALRHPCSSCDGLLVLKGDAPEDEGLRDAAPEDGPPADPQRH